MEVLANISLSINFFFLFEIPLTLWALGLQFMNPFGPVPHASLHLFDSIVIIVTFILEVILRGKERELAGLIVVLRLWRLVKLVGGNIPISLDSLFVAVIVVTGVVVGAGEIEEENARILAETTRQLAEVTDQLAEARDENARLWARVNHAGLVLDG